MLVLVLAAGFGLVGAAAPAVGDCPLFPGAQYDAGDGPWSIAIGDLDGDQLSDLIVANVYGSNVSVLLVPFPRRSHDFFRFAY